MSVLLEVHRGTSCPMFAGGAIALSSSGVEWVQEEKEMTGALKQNGYLSSFVYRNSCPGRSRLDSEEQRPKRTLTLPYISNLFEAIRRLLAPLHIQVVFRPLMKLRQRLVHPKDPVPMDEWKGVVYSILCTECPKVGQTGRCLKQRLKEHRCALKNGDVAASALAKHALTAGHGIDLSKAEATATLTPPHVDYLRAGTFRGMQTGRTESEELSQRFMRHYWTVLCICFMTPPTHIFLLVSLCTILPPPTCPYFHVLTAAWIVSVL